MRTPSLTMVPVLAAALAFNVAHAQAPGDDEAMTALGEHHRIHQHGGITQFVEMSLDTLGEAEAKRPQVEKVQSELHVCMDPVEDNEQSVLLTLADGVAAGKIDAAKVQSAITLLNGSAATIHSCVAKPLDELHELLAAHERAELGEKVRAHWSVWRRVNVDLGADSRDPASALGALTGELNLDVAQADKMAAALKLSGVSIPKLNTEEIQGQVTSFAKAFAAEKFDATSVTTHSTALVTTHGATRTASFFETVTPLLTPEQRNTLAAHLREHANHHAAAGAAGSQR